MQFPPFKHGRDAHSSMSVSQWIPVYLEIYEHHYHWEDVDHEDPVTLDWLDSPLPSQFLQLHTKSKLGKTCAPQNYVKGKSTYPGRHLQVYSLTPSRQVPPCWHGNEAHSSTSWVQFCPLQPPAQTQRYVLIPSKHCAPFWQKPKLHSSTSWSQVAPVKPAAHSHTNSLLPSRQVPELRHGLERHSLTSLWQWIPRKSCVNP